MKNGIVALAAVAGLAAAAAAENTWQVVVTYSNGLGFINNVNDVATVELWAVFDQQHYAFAGAGLNVNASEAGWTSADELLDGPGTFDGTIAGASVVGIITGQLHFPVAKIYADTSNPILAWKGTWMTNDLSARTVDLSTLTSEFFVYLDFDGNNANIGVDFEGSGGINVIPTPGALAALGLGGLVAIRRRR